MRARVYVRLKKGVLDPQGATVKKALEGLGYPEVLDLRVGKVMEIELDETDRTRALARLEEMCRRLLANPVIEEYSCEIEDAPGRGR